MKKFFRLLGREFKMFWANKVLRLLFIGAPLLYGILLGFVYGKGKVTNLPIIVIDEDRSSLRQRIIEMIGDNEVLHIIALKQDQNGLAELSIKEEVACTVIIPKDFEKDVLTRRYPEVTTIVNTANVLTANYASSALQLVLGSLKAGTQLEALRKQGVPESLLMSQYEPFRTTFIKQNNRATNYMYFLWPGILATVLQQVLLLGLALSFASEFERGTFPELIAQSRNTFTLIMVKVLPYLIMSFGIWLLYGLFTIWFKVPFTQNLTALTLIAGVFVTSVSFLGILFSILLPNQLKATEVLMVIATPSFILSGFTWPLSQMPVLIQYIANIIPLTHFLPAFRILMIENGPVHLTYHYVFYMVIIGVVSFIASFIALKIKIKKTLPAAAVAE
jgi:ABC-2 type transport system permease protein